LKSDKAFFFASYQGTRELRTYTATVTVPTPAMVVHIRRPLRWLLRRNSSRSVYLKEPVPL